MSAKRKILWWIESERPFASVSLYAVLIFVVFSADINSQHGKLSVEMIYAMCAAATMLAFQKMSCELSELAWAEPLQLLPGFARALRFGVLRCVALLSLFGALSSLITKHWLPWGVISYAAAALACLHLPVWITSRQDSKQNGLSLKEVRRYGVSWPTLISLALPMLALNYLPQAIVLVVMAVATPVLLYMMWWRLPVAPERTPGLPIGSLLRTPSLLVAAAILFLLLSPNMFTWNEWNGRFNFGGLVMILPCLGLSAMGRQGPELRVLLGRLWLLGMNRAQLCRTGMWRLFLALASEYAIYFFVILVEFFLGRIEWHAFVHLIMYLMVWAILNWTQAVDQLLQGFDPLKGNTFTYSIGLLLCIPVALVIINGSVLTWYGLLVVLCSAGAIPLLVREFVRRFETAELW